MTPFFAFLNTLNTFGASVQTKITSKSSLLSIDQSECIICGLDTEIFPSQLPAGYIDLYLQDIQSVPGGMDKTSGVCSLC